MPKKHLPFWRAIYLLASSFNIIFTWPFAQESILCTFPCKKLFGKWRSSLMASWFSDPTNRPIYWKKALWYREWGYFFSAHTICQQNLLCFFALFFTLKWNDNWIGSVGYVLNYRPSILWLLTLSLVHVPQTFLLPLLSFTTSTALYELLLTATA